MKKITLILFFAFLQTTVQAQEYMDKIVNQACECVSEIEEQPSQESLNMKLGLCILEVAGDYQEELLRDYQIDFENIDLDGEKLGRIIGVKMVSVCPQVFERLATPQGDADEPEVLSASGVVSKVEKGTFIIIHLNENGQTRKYYWITEVDSNIDLTQEFETLKDKKVEIFSNPIDVFDPRIQEYRTIYVITSLEVE